MIPKKIHYVWFGGNPKSSLVESCISSWKKYCPDYEIIEWNESNFDVNQFAYTREAYESKKWAFIADFIRIWALQKYGGLYLDSDVEVLKSFDSLLNQKAFICFEHAVSKANPILEAAIIGSEPNGIWISAMSELFHDKHFKIDNKYDITPLPYPLAAATKKLVDVHFENTTQIFDEITIYSRDYFSPYYSTDPEMDITENTFAIHHFSGTWHSKEIYALRQYQKRFGRIIGKGIFIVFHPCKAMRIKQYKKKFISNIEDYISL